MCFGEEGIEIDFRDMPPVTLIRGVDLDKPVNSHEDANTSANGVGKSTISDVIVYGLYGKMIKSGKLKHDNVINNKTKKDLYVEIRFGKYRVVRTRKPNTLNIWQSDDLNWENAELITAGGMPDTQLLIEKKIGLAYETFKNIVIFSDGNKDCFLECDVPTKRLLAEDMLSLGIYRNYCEEAKKTRSSIKERLSICNNSYEFLLKDISDSVKRLDRSREEERNWKQSKLDKKKTLASEILEINNQIDKILSDDESALLKQYEESIIKIDLNNKEIDSISSEVSILRSESDKLQSDKRNLSNLRNEQDSVVSKIKNEASFILDENKKIEELIKKESSIKSKHGETCPVCKGEIKSENLDHVIKHYQDKINDGNEKISKLRESYVIENKKVKSLTSEIETINNSISYVDAKIQALKSKLSSLEKENNGLLAIKKPEISGKVEKYKSYVKAREEAIASIDLELTGKSPMSNIIEMSILEIEKKKEDLELKKSEASGLSEELKMAEFFVEAFGESGIRKYIVDSIIPMLNQKVAYWMSILMENKLSCQFDNELQETISNNPPDGDLYVYEGLSGGEKRRVNLAISQSFAHVMLLNFDVSPSIVFLDEVTSNIDQDGVASVYAMIQELSKTKKVFVTTHDQGLLDLMHGCNEITLVKKDKFTTIQK